MSIRASPRTDGRQITAPLAGTPALVRFALRRDRVRIPVWIGALTAANIGTATSFADLYQTEADRQGIAGTMNTPAALAMSGPSEYLRDYTVGAMMGHQMLGITVLMAALMSVLMLVRHTRAEEESGRAELVRAAVVGRHAPLAASLIVVAATNLALAVVMGPALAASGAASITTAGSLLYGFAHAAVGIAFSGIAAITAQVTEHSRGAAGMGLAAIAIAYVLRAAGDVGEGVASWLSPIGWAQATWVYVENRWWPLLLAVAFAAALMAAAFALSTRRDVGAGLWSTRPGNRVASRALSGPLGLAFRLHKGLLLGFIVALALFGIAYGSILPEVEQMLADVEMMEEVLAQVGGASLIESFVSMIMLVLAILSSVYVVLATLRSRAEESDGRAEPVLATAVSRSHWLASHVLLAMLGGAAVLLAGGVSIGITGALTINDSGIVRDMLGASLAYLPALWVVGGVTAALFGLVPRFASLAWIVPAYGFVVGYLGQVLQFPEWMNNLSPFGHIPELPAEEFTALPVALLAALAAGLVAIGLAGFRRRDLVSVA